MGIFLFLFLSYSKVGAGTLNGEDGLESPSCFAVKKMMVVPFSLPEGYYMAELRLFNASQEENLLKVQEHNENQDENQVDKIEYDFISYASGLRDVSFIPALYFQEVDRRGEYYVMEKGKGKFKSKAILASSLSLSYKIYCKVQNLSIEGTKNDIFKSLIHDHSNHSSYMMKLNFKDPILESLDGVLDTQVTLDVNFSLIGEENLY